MPDVVGLTIDRLSPDIQPLTCLNGVEFVGPDASSSSGTDSGKLLRIERVSVAPGTPVGPDDRVTVNVAAADTAGEPAFHPCSWVTTTEAAGFLDVAPINASANGDWTGSTDIGCTYVFKDMTGHPERGQHVESELRLAGEHIVDAAAEFAGTTTADSAMINGIGIKAACTPMPPAPGADRPNHRLDVLLPDEHLYIATGWRGESCDVLARFARTATDRIDV
jgi:hypothetical protein